MVRIPYISLDILTNEAPACLYYKPSFSGRRSCNCQQIPPRIIPVVGSYSCQYLSIPLPLCLMVCSAVFLPALFAMSEIPSLFSLRPIVQRHYKAAMYHPFVEGIAITLVDVPITFTILLLYSIVLYFLVGLQRTAGQFLYVNQHILSTSLLMFGVRDSIFFLFVFVTSLMGKALFRSLAAAFQSEAPAQAFAGILILVVSLYSRCFLAGILRSTSSCILISRVHHTPTVHDWRLAVDHLH